MYFSLEIESNSANKLSQAEIAQAVWVIAQKLAEEPELPIGPTMAPVIDSNGNTVGHWLLKK